MAYFAMYDQRIAYVWKYTCSEKEKKLLKPVVVYDDD